MAKPRSRHGGASDEENPRVRDTEDTRAFRAAVSDVTPLRPSADRPHAEALRVQRPRARRQPRMAQTESLGDVPMTDDAPSAADALSFRRPGVRDQTLRHLRRGRYPVEDELDLHGLSQAAARDNLADFIASSSHAGLRCVRVVHGKGYRSGLRGPVLKIAVNTWLRRHPDVLAFASARAIDGGTGAVYVLLR
jgi:DNA-nicking Smr family endonuclease